MIECSDLTTGYPGKAVSQSLAMHIPAGCLVSLVGPNGCGKTTLLKTMAGLLAPKSGAVRLAGADVSTLAPNELALRRAYLPQMKAAPSITVYTLVCHGRFAHQRFPRRMTAKDHEAVESAMELAGVAEWQGENMRRLSGGQCQRVYLALALAQDTPILLLDEPATYLDVGSRFALMRLVGKLCAQGKTIVMSVQELGDAMAYSDRIALMDCKGTLCRLDTPQALAECGELDRIFNVRVQKVENDRGVGYFIRPPEKG